MNANGLFWKLVMCSVLVFIFRIDAHAAETPSDAVLDDYLFRLEVLLRCPLLRDILERQSEYAICLETIYYRKDTDDVRIRFNAFKHHPGLSHLRNDDDKEIENAMRSVFKGLLIKIGIEPTPDSDLHLPFYRAEESNIRPVPSEKANVKAFVEARRVISMYFVFHERYHFIVRDKDGTQMYRSSKDPLFRDGVLQEMRNN